MSETKPRLRRYVATGIVYLALVASVFGINLSRSRTTAASGGIAAEPEAPRVSSTKPYCSLTTNRTYSPNDLGGRHVGFNVPPRRRGPRHAAAD